MLSQDDRYSDAYKFYQGFKNIAYVTGVIRKIGKDEFFIQQTNNENMMLPIKITPETKLPKWAVEEEPAKVTCRIIGRMREDGTRTVVLSLLDIEHATILDMPPEESWLTRMPEGLQESAIKPKIFGSKLADSSNKAEIAGFVQAAFIEKGAFDSSKRKLVILLQQTADPDRAIICRYDGKFIEKAKSVLTPGTPIFITGKYRVKVKFIGEQDENGHQQVEAIPYILTDIPNIATKQTIKKIPEWAYELAKRSGALKPRAGNEEAAGAVKAGSSAVATHDINPNDL